MSHYQFGRFLFDPSRLALFAEGVHIAMRPKTAMLLKVLIEQRRHLLSKQALFEQVWCSAHVQDQSLFQAISEIRKILAPLAPITTHPNLGYQWTLPVKTKHLHGFWQTPARLSGALPIAVMVAVVAITGYITYGTEPGNSTMPTIEHDPVMQSPAMLAFTAGIQQLNANQLKAAWALFDVAEKENPFFLEAGLMKAEIRYTQAEYDTSRTIAENVLEQAIVLEEPYSEVAALSLLSRISERTGQWGLALEWAVQADNNVQDQGFACVAETTHNRIADLLLNTDNSSGNEPGSLESDDTLAGEAAADIHHDESSCEQLRKDLDALRQKPDLSQCLKSEKLHEQLASLYDSSQAIIRLS